MMKRLLVWARGAVVARLLGMEEAGGSNPPESINVENENELSE